MRNILLVVRKISSVSVNFLYHGFIIYHLSTTDSQLLAAGAGASTSTSPSTPAPAPVPEDPGPGPEDPGPGPEDPGPGPEDPGPGPEDPGPTSSPAPAPGPEDSDPTSSPSIGSHLCSSTEVADQGAHANTWFASWVTHMRVLSADPTWQGLVSEWARYEALSPPDKVRFYHFTILFSLTSDHHRIMYFRGYQLAKLVQKRFIGGLRTINLSTDFHHLSKTRRNMELPGSAGGLKYNRNGATANL